MLLSTSRPQGCRGAIERARQEEREACEALYDHEDVLAPVGQSAWGEAYQEGWIAGAQAYRDAIRARGSKMDIPTSLDLIPVADRLGDTATLPEDIEARYGEASDYLAKSAQDLIAILEDLLDSPSEVSHATLSGACQSVCDSVQAADAAWVALAALPYNEVEPESPAPAQGEEERCYRDRDINVRVNHLRPEDPVWWRATNSADDWQHAGLQSADVPFDEAGVLSVVRRQLGLAEVSLWDFQGQLLDQLGEGFTRDDARLLCDYLQAQGSVRQDGLKGYQLTAGVDLRQAYEAACQIADERARAAYAITLVDASGVRSADKDQACQRYRAALEQHLGHPAAVPVAYRAMLSEQENGLDDGPAIRAWAAANAAGERAAFEGWHAPGAAHFELELAR